jgi:HPr kinase/phosphorylase
VSEREPPPAAEEILHASCVAFGDRAALITGPSGSGKSALALRLIALGAELVSDDRVVLSMQGEAVIATAPEAIAGMIEARGVGLMRMQARARAEIVLVAELGAPDVERLPRPRARRLLNGAAPLISIRPDGAGTSVVAALLKGADLIDPDAGE